ncbi:MAG: HEAT repeat domain-containing protein, partial [Nannocystaceae bacterium]
LVLLPGPEVEEALLSFLDEPPRGLSRRTISQKIGLRNDPSPKFLRQLTERLHEKELRRYVLTSLLLQGSQARDVLLAARKRGLEPASDLEVQRLLGGVAPDDATVFEEDWRNVPEKAWPELEDRKAWAQALVAPRRRRIAAGIEAGRHNPPWLHHAAMGAIARHHSPAPIRGHLIALAHSRPLFGRRLPLSILPAYTKLAGWFTDQTLGSEDRCLAGFALIAGRDGPKRLRRLVADTLETAAGDPSAAIRACVARLQGGTDAPILLALLHDPAPEVRASAAFALRQHPRRRRRDRAAEQLARVAAQDSNWRVRENARRAVKARSGGRHPRGLATTWTLAEAVTTRPTWIQVRFPVGDDIQTYWLPPTILDQQAGLLARVDSVEDITVTVETPETRKERERGLFFGQKK